MEPTLKEIYVQACADHLRAMYDGPVLIRVTAPGHPAHYPAGTWFDDRVGAVLVPAGIDPDAIPPVYIMPSGDAIPVSCAELIQVRQIIQTFLDAWTPALEATIQAFQPLIQAFQSWADSIPPEIRQMLIECDERDARKERHRRRYLRMMERGRKKKRR